MIATPLAIGAATLAASTEATPAPTTSLDEALGIGLEGWTYPAECQFLEIPWNGAMVRMAYMDVAPSGAANGRVAFLLHGKNFDSSYWSGPIAWLRNAGYRVVVPDQIGFNKSAKPPGPYRFDDLAANTLLLADHLGVAGFDLIGQSTGGMVATVIATHAPDRVRRLVLEDPIGLVDYRDYIPKPTMETLIAAERAYTATSYRAFIAHFFPVLPSAAYEPFVTWRMRVARSGEFERFAAASAATYLMIHGQPIVGLFPNLGMPVLLTAGSADRSVPLIAYAPPSARGDIPLIPQAARSVVRSIPRGRLVEYAGIGHVPHLEAPVRFRDDVLAFLAE